MTDALNSLRLYPNGALQFDPACIGSFPWPNQVTLPADLNRALTRLQMNLIADQTLHPHNQILRALYNLPGILAFNLSYYRLATIACEQNLPGFIRDNSKPLITVEVNQDSKLHGADGKDYIAVYGQKVILTLLSLMRIDLRLTASAPGYYPVRISGNLWRLRRADAIPRVLRQSISDTDKSNLAQLTSRILTEVERLGVQNDIHIEPETQKLLSQFIQNTLENSWQDLQAYRRFFGQNIFSYFERSLTPYQSALIATACQTAGGETHSTYHGVCQSAGEPDIVTMANACHFWAPTEAFADDARTLSDFIPKDLRHYDICCYDDERHYQRFIRNDMPRDHIKKVAIIGRHVVMRYSAFNMLEFPFYLDLEKRLGQLLSDQGYQVTYKAHPESDWRHFDRYFDQRVTIDWRPFEDVMDEFDAVIYHFGASSTLPPALGSHQHLFMIKDGWHDQRIWPPRLIHFFEEYANMIPATIGTNGLVVWDEKAILKTFLHPKPVHPENRVKDFFCRRYK